VILNIGASTGTYNIPFATESGVSIPFKYIITTPGVGSGEIRFSSWGTSPGNIPVPSSVAHITDDFGNDNSLSVIDRFWSVMPVNYATKPQGEYIFGYDVAEIQSPNTITEATLVAQRWNDVDDLWGDWLYSNTANTTNRTVSVLIANSEDQYDIWTLVDLSSPLPIELARFVGYCHDGGVNISWTTWSEIDNSHFILERSDDGLSFEEVSIVDGSGNSNSPIR
jgi:hypothetical protein